MASSLAGFRQQARRRADIVAYCRGRYCVFAPDAVRLLRGVKAGDTVAVVGDGAVGLCAVLAARRLGAERVISLSQHADRQKVARDFVATDIIEARRGEAVQSVLDLTGGTGADAALAS